MKCKPGYHFVKEHKRISVNGVSHIVEAHCRENLSSKKDFLYKTNLDYLYENGKRRYQYQVLKKIKGYNDNGQFDELIQFWLNYWQEKKLITDEIDPLLIKAIMAVESSYRKDIITKMPNSSATGLMQLTLTTMKILRGEKGDEIKKYNIDITQAEAKNANANIAAGTRWLVYKITTSPNRKAKLKEERIFSGLKYYHSWNKEGEEYANKVLKIYNESK